MTIKPRIRKDHYTKIIEELIRIVEREMYPHPLNSRLVGILRTELAVHSGSLALERENG